MELAEGPHFTFRFGQRVRIRQPHPEAGATGEVVNAYLYRDGREKVFVAVPGGEGIYAANQLEAAPDARSEIKEEQADD
ncbi:MAG TPA: hypothetical protein VKU00_27175 [Chthonomonadaceae bacterium]|nr:hypothetical protein [Chthonomonadaceae bacterium]